jgi:8-amino-7-oxononanoate synthase
MTALDDYRAELRGRLAALAEAGLLRRLSLPQGIDLVSNDYLGLAEHPTLRAAMRAALEEGAAGAAGSRLLRGHRREFDEIEERLAAFCGAETALLFGSGWAANVGLLQALLGPGDLVLSDALNHASLIDGLRLSRARRVVYPHQDLDAVSRALRAPRAGRTFIVTESVFSMDGDLTPLAELAALAEAHGALLIVDEAHATGLYGEAGAGRVEALGLRGRVLATVHTGGKALGSAGAWVAAPAELRELLVNRARSFVFSTAPLPVLAAALHAALDLLRDEPQRREDVHRKAALLRDALARAGVNAGGASAIVPIVIGENEAALALQEGLQAAGFDVRAVRPPTVPAGTARLRATVRFPVSDADLLRFAAEVARHLPARVA